MQVIKNQSEKLGQLRVTWRNSLRLVRLIWSVDHFLFSAAVIASLIPAIIPFITAYVGKLVIDYVVARVNGAPLPFSQLYLLLGISLVVYFLQSLTFKIQEYVNLLLWTKVPIYLNQLIFQKTATLDMQYFEDSSFKDLLQKVRESYNYRPQQHISSILYLLQNVLQLLIAFFALLKLNVLLLLLIIIFAIPEFINEVRQSKLSYGIWGANTSQRKRYWYLLDLLQYPITAKEIKLFDLGHKFLREVKTIQTKFYEENARLARKTFLINTGLTLISTTVSIGIFIFVVFQALVRKITIGDINFYQGVIANFQNGLGGLLNNLTNIFDNSQYIQSLFELLDAKPVILDRKDAVSLTFSTAPTIEFRNVTFSYPGKEEKVLQNFNLIIHPGERIAFVGENGAGKSTIIKLLARFYDVTEGEILINGVNLKDIDRTSWYERLGILFQDFNRYEDSAKQNIHYGNIRNPQDFESIRHSGIESGADEFIQKFEKKYEQILGTTFEGGKELSTGQWQKVALARGFFRNAPVLILDEPTASIDAKAEAEIFERVDRLSKEKTVIIISHRFSTVRNADKIYVIDEGKIKESGSHDELMKLDGRYAKLFKLQAKGYQ